MVEMGDAKATKTINIRSEQAVEVHEILSIHNDVDHVRSRVYELDTSV